MESVWEHISTVPRATLWVGFCVPPTESSTILDKSHLPSLRGYRNAGRYRLSIELDCNRIRELRSFPRCLPALVRDPKSLYYAQASMDPKTGALSSCRSTMFRNRNIPIFIEWTVTHWMQKKGACNWIVFCLITDGHLVRRPAPQCDGTDVRLLIRTRIRRPPQCRGPPALCPASARSS